VFCSAVLLCVVDEVAGLCVVRSVGLVSGVVQWAQRGALSCRPDVLMPAWRCFATGWLTVSWF